MFCLIDDRDEQKARAYKHELEDKIGCKSVVVRSNRW
jgi:hypothetical protein